MAEYKKIECPQCKGTGFIRVPFDPILKDCPACGGTGIVARDIEHIKREEAMNNQEAKEDAGKPRLSLVPTQIIYDIARVREYGGQKHGSTDNWKTVEAQRYVDAMFRHLLAFVADPDGRDEESGLPHLWHLECNAAFLSEMMKGRWQ